ncbi:MAG: exosortase A [Nitrococcus sp.]|nr:exosortase A [Nitrococcus sp.]
MSGQLERSFGFGRNGLVSATVGSAWMPNLLGLSVLVLFILTLFHQTFWSMIDKWATSETYAHGFVIVPISAWLIWRRREVLLDIVPQPAVLAVPVLAVLGLVWVLGEFAAVEAVKQYAVVAMLVTSVWLVAGRQLLRALGFPLLFLFFAVPFGYFLVPPLMQFTSDCAVALVRLSGVPVYREGLTFILPTGTWSVIEACSGLRYLIASFTLGCLYAYLAYRDWLRRALFILASIVVPVIANGLRAYIIVMIGHLSGMRLATGVDHIIYGWIFFGLVMLILFWIGNFWREEVKQRPAPVERLRAHPGYAVSGEGGLGLARMTVLIGLAVSLLAAGPLYAMHVRTMQAGISGASLELPSEVSGWEAAPPFTDWKPHYLQFSDARRQTYVSPSGPVGLYVALYRDQRVGSELIAWGNDIVLSNSASRAAWYRVAEPRDQTVSFQGRALTVPVTRISNGRQYLDVWHWYWAGGQFTASPIQVKALALEASLLIRSDAAALIAIYVPVAQGEPASKTKVAGFIHQALPVIEHNLSAAAGG